MGGKGKVLSLTILVLDLFITSASCSRFPQQTGRRLEAEDQEPPKVSKKDITNPITTVPNLFPAPFASSTTGNPVINPTSNPDTAPIIPNPPINGVSTTTPPSLSASWCIASQSASQTALQVALDYACGYGGADCTGIQPTGTCYYPSTVRDHASYAFNQYYQRNPTPTSCNFGGTAVVTSTDPSTGSCQYQSTSTSSSILNTTNTSGATVFGAHVPSGPSTSGSAASGRAISALTMVFLVMMLAISCSL